MLEPCPAVVFDCRFSLAGSALYAQGHIPGALNRPWQDVTDKAGRVGDEGALKAYWGDTLEAPQLVVYCGSGVTACVNLFALALLGREDATLYAGSWSDWCSYL